MPLFSVVIPLYNKEKSIARALRSVLAQTDGDFEIILVNDGSNDNSVAQSKKVSDARIRFFETRNQGVSAARNFGVEKASGDLIAFLDADDTWEPSHLQVLRQLHADFPEAALHATSYDLFYGEGQRVRPHFGKIPDNWCGILDDFFAASMTHRIAWTSAVAVPKAIFEAVGGFNPSYAIAEDTDLWIRLALRGPVAFCNQVTATHRLDAENRASHRPVIGKNIATFDDYTEAEGMNPSLKRYLDLYRTEFALKLRVAGEIEASRHYMAKVDKRNIPRKTKVLLALPVRLLRWLYAVKKFLERKKIRTSAY